MGLNHLANVLRALQVQKVLRYLVVENSLQQEHIALLWDLTEKVSFCTPLKPTELFLSTLHFMHIRVTNSVITCFIKLPHCGQNAMSIPMLLLLCLEVYKLYLLIANVYAA